jgi:hypothetical protein
MNERRYGEAKKQNDEMIARVKAKIPKLHCKAIENELDEAIKRWKEADEQAEAIQKCYNAAYEDCKPLKEL